MAAAAGATRGCACPSIRTTLAAPAASATSATSEPGRISVSPSAAFYADVDGLCYTARHDEQLDGVLPRYRRPTRSHPAGEIRRNRPRLVAARSTLNMTHPEP